MSDPERVEVRSRTQLKAWLREHHEQSESIWLVTFKKGVGAGHLAYEEIVQEALVWGWIDSLPRALDDDRTMLRLSPRQKGSNWSKSNRERVNHLIQAGEMQPAGLNAVEAAKDDGSWDRLKQAETGAAPKDLAAHLGAGGRRGWKNYSIAVRRRTLEWLLNAKREATRKRRIEHIGEAVAVGEDPTQWTPKSKKM